MLKAQRDEKVIGDVTYIVRPLPAGVALKVMARVLRMAAPAFGDVASLRDAASAVGKALAGLLCELDEDVVTFVCAEFAKVTVYSTEPGKEAQLAPVFDLHFTGRLVECLEWIRFAGEVTYGPLAKTLATQAATPKPAPKAEAEPAAG